MNGVTPSRNVTKLKNLSMILSKLEKGTLYLSRQYVSNALIFKTTEVRQFKFFGIDFCDIIPNAHTHTHTKTTFGCFSLHKMKRKITLWGTLFCSGMQNINLKKLFAYKTCKFLCSSVSSILV